MAEPTKVWVAADFAAILNRLIEANGDDYVNSNAAMAVLLPPAWLVKPTDKNHPTRSLVRHGCCCENV